MLLDVVLMLCSLMFYAHPAVVVCAQCMNNESRRKLVVVRALTARSSQLAPARRCAMMCCYADADGWKDGGGGDAS